ncbi:hypothetical protein TNCV_3208161 [Trichonephila clavipes]|nr:hypothetical protein TNCV_3208161 [Trichonephila clavipes]
MLNQALPEQDLTFEDYVLVAEIAVWGALSDAEIVALEHNNTESDEDESEELTPKESRIVERGCEGEGVDPLRSKLGNLLLRRIGEVDKLPRFMSFRSGGGNVPPFLFRGLFVANNLVRARFPTKDEKSRMSVTKPSVTFIQVHSPAKRASIEVITSKWK